MSERILCGEERIVLTSGEHADVKCSIHMTNPSVTPDLPRGLAITPFGIEGTPLGGSPFVVYTIRADNATGVFTLGGICFTVK